MQGLGRWPRQLAGRGPVAREMPSAKALNCGIVTAVQE